MIIYIIDLEELVDWNSIPSICQFQKSMVNNSFPFGWYVISNVLNKIQVQNVVALAENFFDNPYLLSSQEDTKRVQKQIKCMGRHWPGVVKVVFLDVGITGVEVLDISAQKLKLEFVIDLW